MTGQVKARVKRLEQKTTRSMPLVRIVDYTEMTPEEIAAYEAKPSAPNVWVRDFTGNKLMTQD